MAGLRLTKAAFWALFFPTVLLSLLGGERGNMATDGSAEKIIHGLRESLRNLESLHPLSDEQAARVNKLKIHIQALIEDIRGE